MKAKHQTGWSREWAAQLCYRLERNRRDEAVFWRGHWLPVLKPGPTPIALLSSQRNSCVFVRLSFLFCNTRPLIRKAVVKIRWDNVRPCHMFSSKSVCWWNCLIQKAAPSKSNKFLVSPDICHGRASICEDNLRQRVFLCGCREIGRIRRSQREKCKGIGYILSLWSLKLSLWRDDPGGWDHSLTFNLWQMGRSRKIKPPFQKLLKNYCTKKIYQINCIHFIKIEFMWDIKY